MTYDFHWKSQSHFSIGTKAEAQELKTWLENYLREELHLELSAEKTLITRASQRVRFLGYDITRWKRLRIVRIYTKQGSITRCTGGYQWNPLLALLFTMSISSPRLR